MSDELSSSDKLFYTIKELKGWYQILTSAQDQFYGNTPTRHLVGRMMNTILLAAGEDSDPLAMSGELDAAWSGHLTLVYPHTIIRIEAVEMDKEGGHFALRLWPLTAATELSLETHRSYFDGTETHPRYRGVKVSFVVEGNPVTLSSRQAFRDAMPALQDESIYAAFLALRDAR